MGVKTQAVLFITFSGFSTLPKTHSKLVFVPEPEYCNGFCFRKVLIDTSISFPVHYLINKGMKEVSPPTLERCLISNWLLNAQLPENVKSGVHSHGD